MSAFAGQQRPGAADPGAVERGTVFVFAVAVAIVAIPAWALRQSRGEQCVDHTKRIPNAWIIGRTQAEAHQRQRSRTHRLINALADLRAAADS